MQESPLINDYCFREIKSNDKVGSFSLGDKTYQPLKTFLKDYAKDFHTNNITKTYVLAENKQSTKIVAYISLVCSEITLNTEQKPKKINLERYETFPAVKLARLAVDARYRKSGLGRLLMQAGIAIIQENIMPWVGCRYFLVDSKPNSLRFYEKYGFILLDHKENETSENPLLLLDMHTIR